METVYEEEGKEQGNEMNKQGVIINTKINLAKFKIMALVDEYCQAHREFMNVANKVTKGMEIQDEIIKNLTGES